MKTLRHYHDVGLLVPSAVDPRNGYRRYSSDQLADAHLIRRLREMEVPLAEVRQLLAVREPDARRSLLGVHIDRLEQQVIHTQSVLASLRRMMETAGSPTQTQLPIAVRQIHDALALVETESISAANVEQWSGAAFDRLIARVQIVTEAAGPCEVTGSGSFFPTEFFTEGRSEVTAFVTVSQESQLQGGSVIPGGTYAVFTHIGPYSDLDLSYGTLGSEVAAQYRIAAGPIRERYLVGPGDTPHERDYRTEVCWPITCSDHELQGMIVA